MPGYPALSRAGSSSGASRASYGRTASVVGRRLAKTAIRLAAACSETARSNAVQPDPGAPVTTANRLGADAGSSSTNAASSASRPTSAWRAFGACGLGLAMASRVG